MEFDTKIFEKEAVDMAEEMESLLAKRTQVVALLSVDCLLALSAVNGIAASGELISIDSARLCVDAFDRFWADTACCLGTCERRRTTTTAGVASSVCGREI